jgi:hypothetical protein
MIFRRRKTPSTEILGAELYERVLCVVHDEVDELVGQGRVSLETEIETENNSAPGRGRRDSSPVGGEIRLTPSGPDATALAMTVYDDTVSFGTGEAGAWSEIWSTTDPAWESTVRGLIRCVRDGRYSERVRRGWFFPLKVEMRFRGVPHGRGRHSASDYIVNYSSTLSSDEGRLPMPPEGEFDYGPW